MNATLTRMNTNDIKSNYPLRSVAIVGIYKDAPTPGEPFYFYSEPLTEGAHVRIIATSLVKEVEINNDGMTFKTLNSTYTLTNIKED